MGLYNNTLGVIEQYNWLKNTGFVCEQILEHRIVKGEMKLLVQWLGFEERTWEPVTNISHYDMQPIIDYVKLVGKDKTKDLLKVLRLKFEELQ